MSGVDVHCARAREREHCLLALLALRLALPRTRSTDIDTTDRGPQLPARLFALSAALFFTLDSMAGWMEWNGSWNISQNNCDSLSLSIEYTMEW